MIAKWIKRYLLCQRKNHIQFCMVFTLRKWLYYKMKMTKRKHYENIIFNISDSF